MKGASESWRQLSSGPVSEVVCISQAPHAFPSQLRSLLKKGPFLYVTFQYSWTSRNRKDVRRPVALSIHFTDEKTEPERGQPLT